MATPGLATSDGARRDGPSRAGRGPAPDGRGRGRARLVDHARGGRRRRCRPDRARPRGREPGRAAGRALRLTRSGSMPERSGRACTVEPARSPLCHDRSVTTTPVRRARERLDQLLVERGLAETRTRAQALILAGKVRVGEGDAARSDLKAGDLLPGDETIAGAEREPFVGRGGHKLAAALDAFEIDPTGSVALDVGASTGGFTDVLLQRGATRVYAVDVGRGQLAEPLRRDARVISMERTNARTLTAATLPEPIDLATVDVSFISLELVLAPIASTLARPAGLVALVKPQFEAGKGRTDHGVVRDPAVHREVLERIVEHASAVGLGTRAVIASPITGPEGNREFLIHLGPGPMCAEIEQRIAEVSAT